MVFDHSLILILSTLISSTYAMVRIFPTLKLTSKVIEHVTRFVSSLRQAQFTWDRAEVEFFDEKLIYINLTITHISRTVKGLSQFVYVYEDLPENSVGKILVFVEHNNQYQHSPINIRAKLCDLFTTDLKVVGNVVPEGSVIPDSCPIKKGIMTKVTDLVIDARFIPGNMNIPWKNIKVVYQIYYGTRKLIGHTNFYINIDHDYAISGKYYGK